MPSGQTRSFSGHTFIGFLSFVALGLRAGVLAVAWPSMRETFDVPLGAVGVLFIVGTGGFLLVSTQSGRAIARIGLGAFLVWGAAVAGLGFLGYAIAPTWWVVIGLTFLASLGTAIIDTGLNTYFAINKSAATMNWLHACFGFGGTLGPLVMTVALTWGHSWRWGYVPVGAAYVCLIAVFAPTRRHWSLAAAVPRATEGPAPWRAGSRGSLSLPIAWVSLLYFFAFTGMEGAFGQWPYTLFTEARGIASTTAGLWISIGWGATTGGRIIFGFVVKHATPHTLLRVCASVIIAAAGLLWWNPHDTASFLALAAMAMMLAPLFPICTATTAQRVGVEHAGNVIGFQMAAARLGLALAPGLAGIVAKAHGLESIGAFLLANGVLIFGLNEVVIRMTRASSLRRRPDTTT